MKVGSEKVALITGASSGLGKELAKQLGEKKYSLFLCSRNYEKLKNVAENIKTSLKTECYYESLDISNPENVKKLFEKLKETYGKLDILINNAGVGHFGLVEELTIDQIEETISTNILGTIYVTQEAVRIMKEQGNGTIVTIISTAGKIPRAQESVYVASKWAQRGFMESLKLECRDSGIRIINVYPGGMKTDFWKNYMWYVKDVSKFMDPKDVAEFIIKAIEKENIWVDEIVINRSRK